MRQHVLRQTRWGWPLGFWLLQACTAGTGDRPDNLIPRDRMADILTEIHLTEARVGRMNLRSIDSSNIVYKRLERQIFRKFSVDTAVYTKSYVFYASHPEEMEALYKRVTDQLKEKADQKTPARS